MLLTKLALVTCAFYLAFNVLLEGAMLGLLQWKGAIVGIHFHSRVGGFVFFGMI